MTDIQKNLIAGEWLAGVGEIENRNPSDLTDLVGVFAQASSDQLEATLDQAKVAQREWEAYGMERKQAVLNAIGNELIARCEELGTLLAREEGKPFAEGKGEVYRAGQFFTYYAAECLRQLGENADSVRPGVEIDVRREAVGTVAIISPPLELPPDRNRVVEDRACAVLRQRRGLEACQRNAPRLGCCAGGNHQPSGHPPRKACSAW